MGVGFVLVYLPLLAILTIVAVIVGKKLWLPLEEVHPRWIRQGNVEILGGIGTALLVVLTIYGGMKLIANDGVRLLYVGFVLLLGPFLLGLAFILASRFCLHRGRQTAAIVLNRSGVGALHAVWGVPGGFLFYAFMLENWR